MYWTGKGMLGYGGVYMVIFFIDSHGIIREAYDAFINSMFVPFLWSAMAANSSLRSAHRKFIERWLERIEVERQPWSKFLDYESILTDYDPGSLVVERSSSAFSSRFSKVFPDSDETASDDDGLSLTARRIDLSPLKASTL
ncbi:hypothetical protein CALVIDRAFT_534044 [Calocera viscosa TUFC12733]|uniref:Uncharacterized protein n=1 Tax=Calocera viscosa (strain TUFC12733) TaxID=1330018 RepID=A0A167QC88_CALVF|nr:hypothetical protein CALVIDRAFT_534044 [Calocera viscosa TUFC12733]